MQDVAITGVDLGIISGYFFLVLAIGYVISRRSMTGKDYFLAGNRLGWAAIGFSLFASNISSSSIIGLTGQAYSSGISISNYEWMASFILVFMAIFTIPVYLRNNLSTVPQYLGLRYDTFAHRYYSAVTIVLTIVVDVASSLFAGALVINVFFPSISVTEACYAIALISGIYTAAGGLAAVVYTDILQSVTLLIGSSIMLFAILGQYDFSWQLAVDAVERAKLSIIQPIDDPVLPWLGTLIGVPVLGFYYWSTNQYVVQRILAARNMEQAQWGALLAGVLKLAVPILIVFPGIFAFHLFPDLAYQDMVYPAMLLNLIPAGVTGLVLAGLLAAIMSSVDSALNASSTLIVLDFIVPNRPGLNEKQIARIGRYVTLLVMIVAGIWAPNIEYFSGLFNYLQLVLSFSVPPVVVVFLFGFFWPGGTAKAARYTLVVGHIICFLTLFGHLQEWFQVHFTIIAGILTIMLGGLYMVISWSDEESIPAKATIWEWDQIKSAGNHRPWYLKIRFLALIVIGLTLLLVITFW